MSKDQALWDALDSGNLPLLIDLMKGTGVTWKDADSVAKLLIKLQEERKAEQDNDPSPYCQYCNAKTSKECDCGPICDNN